MQITKMGRALNRIKNKISAPNHSNKNNNNKKKPTSNSISANSNIKRNYWWYHIKKASVKVLKMCARNMVYKYTLKEVGPSKTSWWHPKTKII